MLSRHSKLLKPVPIFGMILCASLLSGCDRGAEADTIPPPLPVAAPADLDETALDSPPNPDGLQLAPGFAPLAFDLAGTGWLVTAVDGIPTADLQDDLATVHFGQSYLRWMGCNQMDALYIPLTSSFALGPPETKTSTCADSKVDNALASVLSGKPLIGRNREGKVMLAGPDHSITLSQIDSGPKDPPAPPLDEVPFEILAPGAPEGRPVMALHNGRFAIWMDCPAAISGSLRLVEGRLRTGNVQIKECETFRPTARDELAAFFRKSPAIARSGDGDLLLSDGITVIAARQCTHEGARCRRTASAIHSAEEDGAPASDQRSVDIPAT